MGFWQVLVGLSPSNAWPDPDGSGHARRNVQKLRHVTVLHPVAISTPD
jgi:hypothetical protein